MMSAELEQAEQDARWLEETAEKMDLSGFAFGNVRVRLALLRRLAQYARSVAPSPQRLSAEETKRFEALEDAEPSEALRQAYARRKTTAEPANSIFILTAVDATPGSMLCRPWVWFRTFEEAERNLREHTSFYFEGGHYNAAVIEEVRHASVGPHPQTWFRVDYDGSGYTIERVTEPPEDYRDTANIGMG